MLDFQDGVKAWLVECLGASVANDKTERSQRFLEESLELVQACGLSKQDVLVMVDYVYSRDSGDILQEIGGTLVCMAAMANYYDVNLKSAGYMELMRCRSNIEKIRKKHAAKPANVARKNV